jgi:PAS domain S-box-containing protein
MINLASHTHDEIPTGARHALETIAARLGSAIDRMRAEETLRENEEQFRALGESAPIGIFLTDAEDLCTYTNTRLQSISGLTLEQSLGHGWYRAIHPDDLGAVLAALSAQAEEGRQFSREFRLLTPQGEVRWVHVRAAPMVSEGNLLGRVGTVEDITERKRAMQALARERKAFRIIADAAVQATDVPGLCRQILTGLVETLGFDLGTIRLYDKQSQILLPTAVVGSSPEELPDEFPPYSLDDRKCVAALVARTRQAFFAPEVHKHAVFQTHFAIISAFGVRSLIAWPILGTQNNLLGVMQLSAFKPMDIPEEDRSFFETVAGMFATVLEHRQAEEARRDSEERHRLLFERNLAAVYRTTLEGRILDCNAAFVRLLGYDTRQEVLERSAWDFYFDSAERETFLVHLQESGALTDYESCLRRRDGNPVWVLENTGLHEQDGVGVIQGTCINITERKQAEEAYRTLVEHSLQGLVITQDGRPVFVNQVFAEMSGYSVEELLAMPVEDAWAILCPEDRVATWGRYQERLRGERPPERRELCAFRKDGSRFWMEVHVSPIEFQGRPAIQAATIDITERKRAEAERENLIGELDSFAHTVAHNLTNPLSSILSFAKLMDDAALPEAKQRRYLDFIVQTGQKMLNITDELMLLAGVRRGEVEVRPLDTAKIITEARKRLVYMIEKYQAEIVIPDAWPLALGHAPWVEEVWVNYLSNAIKYGGSPPHVALGARLEDGMVRFWVRDNGPGIPAEKQDKLFAPFTTFDQVSTKGHGLGLSIVRRIVERLDGQIGVESAEGQGSTFFFTLPACDELDLL